MAHLDTHTETRRFTCSYCNKKFRQKEKLKYHTRIHTGTPFFSWFLIMAEDKVLLRYLQMNKIFVQVNDHICVRLAVKASSASQSWMNTCDAIVEKSVTIVLFAISHMLLAGIWNFTISMLFFCTVYSFITLNWMCFWMSSNSLLSYQCCLWFNLFHLRKFLEITNLTHFFHVPYFSVDNTHLMYNAHPKLFRHSFWCIDNAHGAN